MKKFKVRRRALVGISKLGTALSIAAVSVVAATSISSAATSTSPSTTIIVGTQKLTECDTSPLAYCGTLQVPLDYSMTNGPDIQIAYRWYPAEDPTGGVAAGTVVPVEGGPGYPSIGSVKWSGKTVLAEGGYYYMYGSLLQNFNMLAIDLRGTGKSTPLNCPALQKDYSGPASGLKYDGIVGKCADELNHRWKTANGTYIQASSLFSSVPAAADMAAVVKALDVRKIDLYGDSYGSFFAQVFANHYPNLIRSLILDSTYQTQNLPVWYTSTIEAMPADFDDACSLSPACEQATKGKPAWDDIEALTTLLRNSPISGVVPSDDGSPQKVSMNVVGLINLINDAAGDPMIYRGIDAAARAVLDERDPLPLLRLYADRLAFDEDYFDQPVSGYSALLYMAVSCIDYPQLFNMNANESTRQAELAAAEAKLPASTFAPFTTSEWLAQDQNTEAFTSCLDWPKPTGAELPPTKGQPIVPKNMPVLVLGGQFDTWTPPLEVPKVLAELGGNTRFVELENSTHVVGEGDQPCGSALVQEFVADPSGIQSMNASCAAEVPPIDSVGVYPNKLSATPPLDGIAGNTGTVNDLRVGAAAVETAADALTRDLWMIGNNDQGLYGGTSVATDGERLLTLDSDELIPGVAVSGKIHVTTSDIVANLSVAYGNSKLATLTVSWPLAQSGAMATVTGFCGSSWIAGTTYAPY